MIVMTKFSPVIKFILQEKKFQISKNDVKYIYIY